MRNCKCGHGLHNKPCQEFVKWPCAGWMACGCCRVDGVTPQAWVAA